MFMFSCAQKAVHSLRAQLGRSLAVHTIGARLKAWRDEMKLSQKDAATQSCIPARTYQDYEREVRLPGAESMEAFVRAGINANWLLTGDGPMTMDKLIQRVEVPVPAKLNVPALTAILKGLLEAGAPPEKAVAAAFEFYQTNIERGLITPEGIGNIGKEAA